MILAMLSEDAPPRWSPTTLGNIARYVNGFAFKPHHWRNYGLPIIRIAQMLDPLAPCDFYSGTVPERHRIEDGDLLFSWSATLETLIWDRGPAYLNQHIFKVIPSAATNRRFLHHLLNFHMDGLASKSHGTTMRHITRSDLIPYRVDLPLIPEQRRIAEILDTLDEVIRHTEQLIAKFQQMKQGLLHDLLTRGIDDNGELRHPVRHPEQFKDSPLGRIPREWATGGIEAYLDRQAGLRPGPFGSSITKAMYSKTGFKVYGQEQVIVGDQTIGDYYVSPSKYAELLTFAVEVGDVLISLVGTVGRALVIRDPHVPGIINPRLMRLRPALEACDVEFLKHLVVAPLVRQQLDRNATGGTMPVLNSRIVRALRIPVVPRQEQAVVAEQLDTIDRRGRCETRQLDKLRTLKQGLMDDLLTGRVRVKVPQEAA